MDDLKGSGAGESGRTFSFSDSLASRKNGRFDGLGSVWGSSGAARKRSEWVWSCCCLMGGFLVLLLLLTCIGAVLWLVFRPHSPNLSLQAFNITSLTVKQVVHGKTVNESMSALLSMNSTLVFSATNTNRFSISFSAMILNAMYQDVAVGHSLVPAFKQEANSKVTVSTVLIVDKVNLSRLTGTNVLKDATNDHLPLNLTGTVDTHVHTFGFKTPQIQQPFRDLLEFQKLVKRYSQCCH